MNKNMKQDSEFNSNQIREKMILVYFDGCMKLQFPLFFPVGKMIVSSIRMLIQQLNSKYIKSLRKSQEIGIIKIRGISSPLLLPLRK